MSPNPTTVDALPNRGQGTLSTSYIPAGSVILTDTPILKVHATHANPNGSAPYRFHNLTAAAIKDAYRELTEEQKGLFNTLDAGEPSKLYPDILEKRVRRVLVNGFALGENCQTWIVCPLISRLNHSCVPNACWFQVPNQDVYKLLALRDIAKDEEITLCYRDELDAMVTHARRQLLLKEWGFICTCEACGPFKLPSRKATKGPLKALHQAETTSPFKPADSTMTNTSTFKPADSSKTTSTTNPTTTTKNTITKPKQEKHDTTLSNTRRTLLSALNTTCNFDNPTQLIQLFQQDPLESLTRWWFRAELLAAERLTGKEQAVSWSIAATMLQRLVEGSVASGIGSSQQALGATITVGGDRAGTASGIPEEAKECALRAVAWKRKAVGMMSCCVLEDYDDNLLDFRSELEEMVRWCEGMGIRGVEGAVEGTIDESVGKKKHRESKVAKKGIDELMESVGAGMDGAVEAQTVASVDGKNAVKAPV
ncbi:MAG: hypothetical protein M1831_006685 [Alyxoria varia]|nr:MAG: hypothetical protein M1831_006685 [Alyxoria varia]